MSFTKSSSPICPCVHQSALYFIHGGICKDVVDDVVCVCDDADGEINPDVTETLLVCPAVFTCRVDMLEDETWFGDISI